MMVYRLCKAKYANDLSGRGAERVGGRWNSKGTPMLYTGSSRALCLLELAVHLPLSILPEDYQMIQIQLPDKKVSSISMKELPSDWKSIPHSNSTQLLGDDFVHSGKHLIYKVPSVVVEGDFNYLINPLHRAFREVTIRKIIPFSFDARLFPS